MPSKTLSSKSINLFLLYNHSAVWILIGLYFVPLNNLFHLSIDRFTIKVINENNEQGYFKYNTKTKSVDFLRKNIKNKEMEMKK